MTQAQFKKQLQKYGPALLLVLAAITLFLAQSAYWVNHTVFNQANFTRITTTELLSDSSREAIASAIVNKALDDRPLIKRAIGERATSLISGLLDSDFSNQALTALSNKTYAYATASNRQDISIDLTAVKTPLTNIIAIAQERGANVPEVQFRLPDEITLVRSDSFPDLSGAVRTMLWLGPLFWLSTLVCFGLYIYTGRANYAKRVYLAGLVVIIVGVFGLLTGPFVPPPIAAAVPTIELRPVAQNLVAGFLAPFQAQMYYMIGFIAVVLLAFNQRFNMLGLVNSLANKLSKQPPKKASK